jgi:gas vesicle protein
MTYPSNVVGQSPPASPPTEQPSEHAVDIKERAGEALGAAKEGVGEVGEQVTDSVREVAAETGRQARDLLGEARSQMTQQAGEQHHKLVTSLRALADEMASMSQQSGQSGIATEFVTQAGDRVRSVADWLSDKQPGDVVAELRRFGRNRPGTFLVGAMLGGVVAGRMTRAVVASHTGNGAAQSGANEQPAAPTTALPTASALPPASTPPASYPPPPAPASGYSSGAPNGGLA